MRKDKSKKIKDKSEKKRGFLSFILYPLSSNGGYAALTTTLLTIMVSLTIIGGFTFFSFQEVNVNRVFVKSIESRYVAEGGVEDAVYRLTSGKQLGAQETLTVGKGVTTIKYTVQGSTHTVRSEGTRDKYGQNLETQIVTGSTPPSASFNYGAQVGAGGVVMDNSTSIVGSIYSNGNITGSGGQNAPYITQDALAAGFSKIEGLNVTGNARAGILQNINVDGSATSSTSIDSINVKRNAYAASMINSIVGNPSGNAYVVNILAGNIVNGGCYYQTKDEDTLCTGGDFPGGYITPPAALPALDMPIPDSQLDTWETDAAAGGVHSSPCPLHYDTGDNVTIGPKKIDCDMEIKGQAVVTIAGTIWVKGNLEIGNSAQVKLSSSYGSNSGVIVVDNPGNRLTSSKISVANSATVSGSGTSGSYLLLISRNNSAESGEGEQAITVKNTGTASIYYAPHGLAAVENSATLKELTAWKLHIKNTATLVYESGLQNVNFPPSGGGGGGYDVKYWKEVE